MKLNLRLALLSAVVLVLSLSAVWAEQFSNFALTTLASTIGSSDTTLTVASTVNFPGTATFRLVIQDSQASTPEIVMVTGISGNVYTVTRGLEGSIPSSHSSGAQVAQFVTAGVITDIYSKLGDALPAGTSGQIQYNNAGALGAFTASGDCGITPSTGAVICTKTNGVLFAPSATTDATNAANISSGTLPAGRLPNPTGSTLGGVQSLVATAHQWINSISTSGIPIPSQPACGDLSNSATSCSTDTTNANNITSGILAQINGGTGQVPGLTFNSTGAAAANISAIQTTLTAGGHVVLNCPSGSVIYINATLVINSNTKLDANKGCTIRAVAGTGALLQNFAASSPWTTLYDNSGVITNGPLSVIWNGNTPAWSSNSGSGTSYAKGGYVVANTNIYWESVTSCTGATSGTGPSGTGSGISDGTCSWNYVTTAPGNFDTQNIRATIHWPSHGLSVGSAIWITPQPDNTASSNIWTGTQTAHTAGGPADSAYFGVFSVTQVNDANYLTVTLRRAPAAAFTGIPMNIKVADQDIQIGGGGAWDYNYTVNSGFINTPINAHNIVMAGVSGLKIDGVEAQNTQKFDLCLCGVSDADVAHLNGAGGGNQSDRIKVYGPAFDIHIHDSRGLNGDDVITLSPEEGATFASYVIAAGDIIGANIHNVTSDSGFSFGIIASNALLYTDQIEFAHISNVNGAENILLRIVGNGTGTAAQIGTVSLHDVYTRTAGELLVSTDFTQQNEVIQQLNIYNFSSNPPSSATIAGNGDSVFNNGNSGAEIRNLNIYGGNHYGSGFGNMIYGAAGTIDNLLIHEMQMYFNSSNASIIDGSTSAAIKNITLSNNYIKGTPLALINDRWGANINLINNYVPDNTRASVSAFVTGVKVYAAGNYMPLEAFGMLRYNANTIAATLSSGGGNVMDSGVWITNYTSGSTITPYGFDIQFDVTKATRTTGSFGYNTNAAPGSGTLTTAGPVMDQGTSANSWFLMSNPSGQQY